MHPIVSALSKKARPKFAEAKMPAMPDVPKIFEINHKDMPSLKSMRPGDKVKARVHGVIHSMDRDGRVVLHVNKVLDDNSVDSNEANDNDE